MSKRDAQRHVRQHGGIACEPTDTDLSLIVVGADELPLAADRELLTEAQRHAASAGSLEVVSETEFWARLGLVDGEQNIRRLHTPAMLAELLGVSVATIRRWHRRGLIVPAREVNRLPYFDFQEVATARQLASLVAAGVSPASIQKQLAELAHYVPGADRPLAQLSVIVEGKRLLLRQGEGLVEPSGQLRIDFDAIEARGTDGTTDSPATVLLESARVASSLETAEQMIDFAARLEEEGQLEAAIEMYRAVLAAGGARPEINFALAELLYRVGDTTAARERYYATIELDEDYVEARANLGCVLVELNQLDLAVAAFQGALVYHHDYPDVHYHLARTLEELDRHDEALGHWRSFLALAPDSPWAAEARERL